MKDIINQIRIGFENMLICLVYLLIAILIIAVLSIISFYIIAPQYLELFLSFIIWLGGQA